MVDLALVPGFTQTRRSWDAVVAALGHDHAAPSTATEVNPIALDVPRRGSFASTAAALGEHGGVAAYAGYSMGGRLCLQLALDRPDLVRHLVLVSASPGIDEPAEREARRSSDDDLARSVERDGVEMFLRRWLAQPMFATVPDDAAGLADRSRLTAEFLAHCLRTLGTGSMPSLWSRLGTLAIPVTLVTGTRDPKFGAIARSMLARMPAGAAHTELDCGHAVLLERPAELAGILTRVASGH